MFLQRIIILSGRICSGKTTLADLLSIRFHADIIQTKSLIRMLLPDTPLERRALQRAGEALDRKYKGKWVANALSQYISRDEFSKSTFLIVDSIRIKKQIDALRKGFGSRILHIHLEAPLEVLEDRYKERGGELAEFQDYNDTQKTRLKKQ